eukprot:CAMPEP_0202702354 /NCGR_PEP_ID=MMETSP1385-20130828/15358_1 /ASSEMBLY_ACC=CAM_ASM_000861 /TAXON_ID=933848 /ORGANISM="Elphidium margaritaceum" /LENGTH=620 /DNA_ID=CAMNT_0049359991 /DNA_START=341 /DNA_END=2200 /DNA_ORIENTATION=-
MTNDVRHTLQALTRNHLDGIPNERALLDYWNDHILSPHNDDHKADDDTHGVGVVVFELDALQKIRQRLGWKSGDNIIKEIGLKIKEYCDWYAKDLDIVFQLFHPEFAMHEFVVVVLSNDEDLLYDFCECVLTEIARSVKCYFDETIVWAGFCTDAMQQQQLGVHISGLDAEQQQAHVTDFRKFYEQAKAAIADGMKLCTFSDDKCDRIRKWLSPAQRSKLGYKVLHAVHAYYVSGQKESALQALLCAIEIELKKGADLNCCDAMGNTAIFYALSAGSLELIQYLLHFDFDADHCNNVGQTALVHAMKRNLSETVCCRLAQRLKFPNLPDQHNTTPFVWAMKNSYFRVMQILSDKGCVDYKEWIVSACIKDQHIVLADIVQETGVPFECKLDDIGRCVLHYAVLHESFRIIEQFLEQQRINVEVADNNGWTALHYAAAKGYVEIAVLLLQFAASLACKTEENYTPIDIAFKFNQSEMIALFTKHQTLHGGSFELYHHISHRPTPSISDSEHSNLNVNSDDSVSEYEPIRMTRSATPQAKGIQRMAVLTNSAMVTPKSELEQFSDSVSCENQPHWNKENAAVNVMQQTVRNRADSDSQSNVLSKSANSENAQKSTTYSAKVW